MGAAGGARSARVATAPGGCKTRAAIPRPARGYAPTPRRHPRVRPGGAILRHLFPGVRFPFDGPSLSPGRGTARGLWFFLVRSFRQHSNGAAATVFVNRFDKFGSDFHALLRWEHGNGTVRRAQFEH